MAKTHGSLFSLNAHGSIAKTLTFSKRKSGQQCRSYNKPLKDPSAKQRGQRRLTEFLVAQWQNMSDADKATWDASARVAGLNIAGYHYFLREAQRDLYTHTGLCLYTHLNEYVAGEIKDISGNGLDGTPGPSYPTNAPTLIKSRSAKFSNALSFDGVDEYVNFGNQARLNFGTGDFTIIAWFYLDGDQNFKSFLAKRGYVTDEQGYRFLVSSGPLLSFTVGDGTDVNRVENISFPANEWICIVARRFGWNIDVYLNNVFKATQNWKDPNVDTTASFYLGATNNISGFIKGRVDEVCLYNRKLETAELTTRYNFALREAG